MDSTCGRADHASDLLRVPVRGRRFIDLLVPAILLAGVIWGCAVRTTVPLIPETGGSPAQMRLSGSLKSNGSVKITLPGGKVLEGRWDDAGTATDLENVVVPTPNGVVSAADLAGAERPRLVVNLWGHDLRMICVCTGDSQSRYLSTCVDSDGTRWVSIHRFSFAPR